jgi:hypothetical protein
LGPGALLGFCLKKFYPGFFVDVVLHPRGGGVGGTAHPHPPATAGGTDHVQAKRRVHFVCTSRSDRQRERKCRTLFRF